MLAIANTAGLHVSEADLVLQAITWHAEQNVDFRDAYNAAWLLARKLSGACTFDRKHFGRLPGAHVVVPGEDEP